jgi:hypothetical protein
VGLGFATEKAPAGATEKNHIAQNISFAPSGACFSFNDCSHGCTVGYCRTPFRGWVMRRCFLSLIFIAFGGFLPPANSI